MSLCESDSICEWTPTLNQSGYISSFRDPCTARFISRAAQNHGPALELGCGFGHASLWALEVGTQDLTVSDSCVEHLEEFKRRAAHTDQAKIALSQLPECIDLPRGHFDAILVSRVLHFFDGDRLRRSIKTIADLLRPHGSAFIICDSVHAPVFVDSFGEEYEQRLRDGVADPGYFLNAYSKADDERPELPSGFHFFEEKTLVAPFSQAGLEIVWIAPQARPDYPPFKIMDGREAFGLEVRRP